MLPFHDTGMTRWEEVRSCGDNDKSAIMTLELFLLRHVKSSWDIAGQDDFLRDLAPRGIRAGKSLGRLMAARSWVPDLVLCSSATRTRRTLDLLVESWDRNPQVEMLRSLYLASQEQILDIIVRQPDSAPRLMVVGHNPGLQRAGRALSHPGRLRDELIAKYPTGGLLRLHFDVCDWAAIGRGTIVDYIRPRELEADP